MSELARWTPFTREKAPRLLFRHVEMMMHTIRVPRFPALGTLNIHVSPSFPVTRQFPDAYHQSLSLCAQASGSSYAVSRSPSTGSRNTDRPQSRQSLPCNTAISQQGQ